MNATNQLPRSFNTPISSLETHRRSKSEPLIVGCPGAAFSVNKPTLFDTSFEIAPLPDAHAFKSLFPTAPISSVLKPQYSIRRRRPNSEFFGPEIILGEPKEHVGHPKTRIGQSTLKLAAIKERMELLEAANEKLAQRIESYKTDAEMLNSSVTYFSSEYYASLLTIRDLRTRTRQDADIMSNQEQQLCQLKKFVGLIVEIGLHEPVLERAQGSVLAGEDFERVLIEAIRIAAARRGSAWSTILSAAVANGPVAQPVAPTDRLNVLEEHSSTSTVDDLLKNLKNGDVPFGRHRSSTAKRLVVKKSPARNSPAPSKNKLRPKSPVTSPRSPLRPPLGKIDLNRKRTGAHSSKPAVRKPSASQASEGALASLQRILDSFSIESLGSLETSMAEGFDADAPRPSPAARPRLCVRRPTMSDGPKCVPSPSTLLTPTPTRSTRQCTAKVVFSPVKNSSVEGSPPSPGDRLRPMVAEAGSTPTFRLRKGWR